MYTHTLEVKTGECNLEADVQFNGDAIPGWKAENVELSNEQTQMLNLILECVNKLHHRCGGITKLEINLK